MGGLGSARRAVARSEIRSWREKFWDGVDIQRLDATRMLYPGQWGCCSGGWFTRDDISRISCMMGGFRMP